MIHAMTIPNRISTLAFVMPVLILSLMGTPKAVAQDGGPPKLSANPANHVIFPAKEQTPEQQAQDTTAAYDWATKQTGWDPYKAHDALVEKGHAAAQTSDAAKGGAVKGAAGGALLGVAIGAIADDPGHGAAIGATAGGMVGAARTRRTKKAASSASDQATAAYKQQFAVWDKNFVAAMEGKGYTVK
jgi:hypothetical protein